MRSKIKKKKEGKNMMPERENKKSTQPGSQGGREERKKEECINTGIRKGNESTILEVEETERNKTAKGGEGRGGRRLGTVTYLQVRTILQWSNKGEGDSVGSDNYRGWK